MIKVAARASPLSKAQVKEVLLLLQQFHPAAAFDPVFQESLGDLDLTTSLRSLDKTDFFTREIDQLLLKGTARIAIHSAKDLPEPIPKGLKMIALTSGKDPADSLVFREYDTLDSLPKNSLIATSSAKREEAVRQLRDDFIFRDLRGTISKRLELLTEGKADGVVVAEAALLRLNLHHLNRIKLPGATTPFQGQLAILSREDDEEMAAYFAPLDSRLMKNALYLGPEFPFAAFQDRKISHCPLIQIIPRKNPSFLEDWPHFTHVILSSKSALSVLAQTLRENGLSPALLSQKTVIAVGQATGFMAKAYGCNPLIAKEETSEGILEILETLSLNNAYFFWPHSKLSRPLIESYLIHHNACFYSCILYDTESILNPNLPPLAGFQEILFSSPSTVSAFFSAVPKPPEHLELTPIGKVTSEALAKFT